MVNYPRLSSRGLVGLQSRPKSPQQNRESNKGPIKRHPTTLSLNQAHPLYYTFEGMCHRLPNPIFSSSWARWSCWHSYRCCCCGQWRSRAGRQTARGSGRPGTAVQSPKSDVDYIWRSTVPHSICPDTVALGLAVYSCRPDRSTSHSVWADSTRTANRRTARTRAPVSSSYATCYQNHCCTCRSSLKT